MALTILWQTKLNRLASWMERGSTAALASLPINTSSCDCASRSSGNSSPTCVCHLITRYLRLPSMSLARTRAVWWALSESSVRSSAPSRRVSLSAWTKDCVPMERSVASEAVFAAEAAVCASLANFRALRVRASPTSPDHEPRSVSYVPPVHLQEVTHERSYAPLYMG